ncbi:MAG: caspase domain-containing protein [Paracoccus sp. (in: a-proteobacteria)]
MKKALVVGIDDYAPPNELSGCVNDAVEMAALLESNGDGSPNFDVRRLISSEKTVDSSLLDEAVRELFSSDSDIVLLYFAGHGILDADTNSGFLVTQDASKPNWGVNLAAVLELANKAHPKIKSTVILLDSCQSGFSGEITGLGGGGKVSHIGTGVTILTACHREGFAAEENGHGSFTGIMLDGLGGAACDVIGRVTPAALYAHVDQTLGAWEQRPIYKANVQHFIALREVSPRVPKEILRRLPTYFPTASSVFRLNPSFEPDRGEESDKLRNVPVDQDNERIYRDLQTCNRHGLVVPTQHEHMWHSAIYSGGCRLTATGAHYRRLAEKKKI